MKGVSLRPFSRAARRVFTRVWRLATCWAKASLETRGVSGSGLTGSPRMTAGGAFPRPGAIVNVLILAGAVVLFVRFSAESRGLSEYNVRQGGLRSPELTSCTDYPVTPVENPGGADAGTRRELDQGGSLGRVYSLACYCARGSVYIFVVIALGPRPSAAPDSRTVVRCKNPTWPRVTKSGN